MHTEHDYTHYDAMALKDLIVSMHAIQLQKEIIEGQLKDINAEFDFLRITKIPTQMEDEGVDRITITGIGRVSLTADLHVSVKTDMKAKFYDWLRDNGRSDLISETVNASTLKAAVKGMYKAGEEIPEDLLNVSPFTRASITKA